MEFAPIYFEPEVYSKLVTSLNREAAVAMTNITINKGFNTCDYDAYVSNFDTSTASDGLETAYLLYTDVRRTLDYLRNATDSFDKEDAIQDIKFSVDIMSSELRLAENPEVQRCITAMLKDVYLWLNRYYNSEAMAANNVSQGFLGEADKYLEKNNQLHIQ